MLKPALMWHSARARKHYPCSRSLRERPAQVSFEPAGTGVSFTATDGRGRIVLEEELQEKARLEQKLELCAQMATSIVKRTIHGRGLALTFFSMKGNAWRRLSRMIPQYQRV